MTNLQEKAKVGDWTEPAVMKDLLRFRCLVWMCSAEHIEFGPSFLRLLVLGQLGFKGQCVPKEELCVVSNLQLQS